MRSKWETLRTLWAYERAVSRRWWSDLSQPISSWVVKRLVWISAVTLGGVLIGGALDGVLGSIVGLAIIALVLLLGVRVVSPARLHAEQEAQLQYLSLVFIKSAEWCTLLEEKGQALATVSAERDRLLKAVNGDTPVTGPGLQFIRQSWDQTKPKKEEIARLLKTLSLPELPPYHATLYVRTTDDVPAAIEVRWSAPAVRGPGEYRDRVRKQNFAATAKSLNPCTILYDFSFRDRRTIPKGTVIMMLAYTPNFGLHALRVEARAQV